MSNKVTAMTIKIDDDGKFYLDFSKSILIYNYVI